jgi:hypothetical protein
MKPTANTKVTAWRLPHPGDGEYGACVTWIYWLLAPVVLTALGMVVMLVRGQHDVGRPTRFGRGVDALSEHQQLLDALARAHPPITTPLNMSVTASAEESPKSGS